MNIRWSFCYQEELFRDRKKKREKRRRNRDDADGGEELLEEELQAIPRPRWCDVLPCKLIGLLVWLVVSIPSWVQQWREEQEEKKQLLKEEAEAEKEEEEMAAAAAGEKKECL